MQMISLHGQQNQSEFKNKYKIIKGQIYGEGCYGQIYQCKKLEDNDQNNYCVKIIPKNSCGEQNIDALSDLQKTITKLKQHSQQFMNLVQIEDIILDNQAFYIIMEQCDLDLTMEFDQLQEEKKWYSEEEVIEIISQIITGYKELHSLNIIHQNIKPENILIKYDNKGQVNENKIYKISDFYIGTLLSKFNNKKDFITTGSPNYSAPQVFENDVISPTCDIYSLGILFYQICYKSELPYDCSSMQKRYQSLQNLKINPLNFPPLHYKNKDIIINLLKKMIVYRENDRISFEALFRDPIIQTKSKEDTQEIGNFSIDFGSSKLFDKSQNLEKKRLTQILTRSQILQRLLEIFYNRFKICQYLLSVIIDDENMLFLKLNIYLIAQHELLYAVAMVFIWPNEIHPYILENTDQLQLFYRLHELQQEIKIKQADFQNFKNFQDSIQAKFYRFQDQFKNFQMQILLRGKFTKEQELFFQQSRSKRIEIAQIIKNIINFQQTQLESIKKEEQQLLDQITKFETRYPISLYKTITDIISQFPNQIRNQENDF